MARGSVLLSVLLFVQLILDFHVSSAITADKRQATGNSVPFPAVPADDLLPPPALSAAFPTLRPRNPPPPQQRNPPGPQRPRNPPPPQQQRNPPPSFQQQRIPPQQSFQQQRIPPQQSFQQQRIPPPPFQQQRNPPQQSFQQQRNPPAPFQQQRNPPAPQQFRNPQPPQQRNPPLPRPQQQRNPQENFVNAPPRDLIPPQNPQRSPPSPAPTTTDLPLLPPIEIPPERPINEFPPTGEQSPSKPTSFLPTTGQGAGLANNDNAEFVLESPAPAPGPSNFPAIGNPELANPQQSVFGEQNKQTGNPSSIVRFPESDSPSPLANACPSCECTNEVDHICASDGVIYLNTCAFDCATFCVEGLTKVELGFCSSQNK